MIPAIRFKLLFGPYRMPRCHIGGRLKCRRRGWVTVVAISDAPIAWPMTQHNRGGGVPSIILCGDLVRAIRRESSVGVAHHWRVSIETVWAWRKILGVGQYTTGTMRLKRDLAFELFDHDARAKALASTQLPQRNAKIAAAMRGRKMPPHVKAKLLKSHLGRRASLATRRKMSETHKKRGSIPPHVREQLWTPAEDALLGTAFDKVIAARLGRTWHAVSSRRERLGIPSFRLGRNL